MKIWEFKIKTPNYSFYITKFKDKVICLQIGKFEREVYQMNSYEFRRFLKNLEIEDIKKRVSFEIFHPEERIENCLIEDIINEYRI